MDPVRRISRGFGRDGRGPVPSGNVISTAAPTPAARIRREAPGRHACVQLRVPRDPQLASDLRRLRRRLRGAEPQPLRLHDCL